MRFEPGRTVIEAGDDVTLHDTEGRAVITGTAGSDGTTRFDEWDEQVTIHSLTVDAPNGARHVAAIQGPGTVRKGVILTLDPVIRYDPSRTPEPARAPGWSGWQLLVFGLLLILVGLELVLLARTL